MSHLYHRSGDGHSEHERTQDEFTLRTALRDGLRPIVTGTDMSALTPICRVI
jgi:hypothetical protein